MRELRRGHDVADRVDALGRGAHVAVDGHEPALVDLHAGLLEPDTLRARAPTDADHDLIDREPLLARLALEANRDVGGAAVEAGDLHTGLHLDAALGERAHDGLRDLLVDAGEHLRQRLEDRDLRADVDEERRELASDRAAAHDRDAAGHPAHLQHVVGRQHALAVELEAGNRELPGRGAGRDQHVPAADLGAAGRHGPCARRRASEPVPGTIVTLRPLSSISRPPTRRSTTACLRTWVSDELDRRRRRVHPELGRAADRPQHLGRLEELLGRDAPAVQAGAAEAALLDDRDAQAGRRAVERGRVAARAAAEHDEVEVGRIRAGLLRQDADLPGGRSAPHQLHGERREDHDARESREDDVRARAHAGETTSEPGRLPQRHGRATTAGIMHGSWLDACSEWWGWRASCPSPKVRTPSARESRSEGSPPTRSCRSRTAS